MSTVVQPAALFFCRTQNRMDRPGRIPYSWPNRALIQTIGFIGIPATTRFCSKVDDNRYAITCADTHNGNRNFNGESMQVIR